MKYMIVAIALSYSSWICGQINVEFSVNESEACEVLAADFLDESSSTAGTIVEWQWTLGSFNSSLQNPSAIFNTIGNVEICLSVKDDKGNEGSRCKEDYIRIYKNPIANFELLNNGICAPASIEFNDLSTTENDRIVNWTWGLGGSSNVIQTSDPNTFIESTYSTGDLYTISLLVEDDKGCTALETKNEVLEILHSPKPSFTSSFLNTCELPAKVEIDFTEDSEEAIYYWDFGNGETYIGTEPPLVLYPTDGKYEIILTARNEDCETILTKEINVKTNPDLDLEIIPGTVCVGNEINFDLEEVAYDSVQWTIESVGTFTAFEAVTVLFDSPGCFEVRARIYSGSCIFDYSLPNCVEVLAKPDVNIITQIDTYCDVPSQILFSHDIDGNPTVYWKIVDPSGIEFKTTEQSSSYQANEFGTYEINLLYVFGSGCFYRYQRTIQIQDFEVLVPVNGPQGCIPLDVTLFDSIQSSFNIVSLEWLVEGNGFSFSSSDSEPSFTLEEVGTYDLTLIAKNSRGCIDTLEIENYIAAGTPPEVDFSYTPFSQCARELFNFYDESSAEANDWYWQFTDQGDGIYQENPEYQFGDTGYFNVIHVAMFNGCPSDTMRVDSAVYVLGPISHFKPEYNCEDPYSVFFKNNSIAADSFIWKINVGNDVIYNTQDSFDFLFPGRGDYVVELYTENYTTGCDFLKTDTVFIRDPIAQFTLDKHKGCAPLTLQISESSIDAERWLYSGPGAQFNNDTLTTPELDYLNAGGFLGPKLVVTDMHGCKDSMRVDSVFVNSVDALPLYDKIVCIPDNIPLEDASVSMFGEVNSWSWNIGNSFHSSTDKNTSYYLDTAMVLDLELIVQDSWGCVDTFFRENAIKPVINFIDFDFESQTCTQDPIQFTNLSTGQNIIGYLWDFGDGFSSTKKDPNHYYTKEGTYTVCLTIEEEKGCQKTRCKENIIEVINPEAAFIADQTSIDCPPLIANFTNNSTNADSFVWDFGDNGGLSNEENPSNVFTEVGTFDVTLIAMLGENCADTLLIEDYIQVNGPVGDFSFQSDNACVPLTVEFFGDSDSDYNYTWDFGNGEIVNTANSASLDTVSYIYNEVGTYTPKLILSNQDGCIRSFTGNPIVVNDINLDFSKITDPFCGTPQVIELENKSTASGNAEYNWSIQDEQSIYYSDLLDLNLNITKPGIYYVTLEGSLENCEESLRIDSAIIIASIPNVLFDISEDITCQFSSIHLQNNTSNAVGEISNFYWDFGDGNTSTEEYPEHTYAENNLHIISLKAITEYGCVGEHQINTEVIEAANVDILPLPILCLGDTAIIDLQITNPQAGSIINWEDDPDLSCTDCANPSIQPTGNNTYFFNYIQENGCVQEDSVQLSFFDIAGPEVSLSTDDIICNGDSSTISILNYNSDYDYTWQHDQNFSHLIEENKAIRVYPDTSTTIGILVSNQVGCSAEISNEIHVDVLSGDILPVEKIHCVGDEIELNIAQGNDAVWSGTGLSCNTCPNPSVLISTGESEYLVQITSDNGCPFTDTLNIIGIPNGFVNAGPDANICLGETIELQGTALGTAEWQPSPYLNDVTNPQSIVKPEEDSYFVFSSVIGECMDTDTVFINVLEAVIIEAIGDSICFDEIGTIAADGNALEYNWMDMNQNNILSTEKTVELSPESTTNYMVVGKRGICIADTQYTQIYVHDEIIIDLEEDYTVFPNVPTQVIIDYNGDFDFEWFPHEGLSCWDCPDPFFEIIGAGEYELVVTDPISGCQADARLYARYETQCTNQTFYLPNIFSPNGDGRNDEAMVFAQNPNEFISLSIFDRWGEQMFYSEDLNEGWDGYLQGEEAIIGVYVMKIQAICESSKEAYTFYADITLAK